MKKLIVMLLALLLALLPCGALAEEFTWMESEVDETWYELSAENTVLTVRLPGNTKTGLSWSYEISDPYALELITHETLEGESEGMAGAPTTYVASFMTMAGAQNTVSLILRNTAEGDDIAVETRVLEITAQADNTLTVSSVLERETFADWCEYGDEGCILTVRLPGTGWSYETVNPEMIELITGDSDAEGCFAASFMATMTEAGNAEIVFASADGQEFRSVNMFVNESGVISVNWVENFAILAEPQLAYCEICSGWFEVGNVFRNHICIAPTEAPVEEKKPVDFKTVNVTANTLNVRAGAGTGFDVVTKLSKGDNARYLGETAKDEGGAEWYKITADGKTGWIAARYAKLGGHGYVKIVNGNCNLRSNPNLDGKVITVASEGAVVTYLGQGSTDDRGTDWYKVSVGGSEGWISSKYARFVASAVQTDSKKNDYKYVQIKGGSCNMRKSGSLNASSIMTVKEGAYCTYLGEKATDDRGVVWYKVSYEKKTGWVSSKYAVLAKSKPEAKPTAKPVKPEQEPDDMRLVLNPNRYDVLCVTDIASQNGRDYYITGCFGTINANGEPEYFNREKCVTMPLTPGAEVFLPADLSNEEDISMVESPEIWFNDARNYCGGSYSFYATFSMNESGELRSIVYRVVY